MRCIVSFKQQKLRLSVSFQNHVFHNFQMDWLSSLKNGFAGITSFRSNQPTVADSLAPDHSHILTQPVPETQFCLLICHILQNIASVEIRSRNLKTSYELSLILTQFACDELSVLSKGTTNCHVSQSSRHELQIALVSHSTLISTH